MILIVARAGSEMLITDRFFSVPAEFPYLITGNPSERNLFICLGSSVLNNFCKSIPLYGIAFGLFVAWTKVFESFSFSNACFLESLKLGSRSAHQLLGKLTFFSPFAPSRAWMSIKKLESVLAALTSSAYPWWGVHCSSPINSLSIVPPEGPLFESSTAGTHSA